MKLLRRYSFAICLLLLLVKINIYCNSQNNNEKNTVEKKVSYIDTLPRPMSKWSDSLTEDLYKKLTKHLKLEELDSKSFGTEIRIWYLFSDSGRVIQIRNKNNKWNSIAHEFKLNINTNHEITSVENRSHENDPLNGWDSFLERIEQYGIYNLKNYTEIPNYYLSFGGDYFFVEILRNGSYKKYIYLSYEDNEKRIGEIQRLLQIIFLIQREFGYNLMGSPKHLKPKEF
jgi:hypothetical protein